MFSVKINKSEGTLVLGAESELYYYNNNNNNKNKFFWL